MAPGGHHERNGAGAGSRRNGASTAQARLAAIARALDDAKTQLRSGNERRRMLERLDELRSRVANVEANLSEANAILSNPATTASNSVRHKTKAAAFPTTETRTVSNLTAAAIPPVAMANTTAASPATQHSVVSGAPASAHDAAQPAASPPHARKQAWGSSEGRSAVSSAPVLAPATAPLPMAAAAVVESAETNGPAARRRSSRPVPHPKVIHLLDPTEDATAVSTDPAEDSSLHPAKPALVDEEDARAASPPPPPPPPSSATERHASGRIFRAPDGSVHLSSPSLARASGKADFAAAEDASVLALTLTANAVPPDSVGAEMEMAGTPAPREPNATSDADSGREEARGAHEAPEAPPPLPIATMDEGEEVRPISPSEPEGDTAPETEADPYLVVAPSDVGGSSAAARPQPQSVSSEPAPNSMAAMLSPIKRITVQASAANSNEAEDEINRLVPTTTQSKRRRASRASNGHVTSSGV